MKVNILIVLLVTIFCVDSFAACLVTASNGKQYYYPNVTCDDFIINQAAGEDCLDAAFGTSSTPANTIPIKHTLKKNGEYTDVWDATKNIKIATLTQSGVAKFQGVFEVIETSFNVEEKDGKTRLVHAKNSNQSFVLSKKGAEKLKMRNVKKVKAIEMKENN